MNYFVIFGIIILAFITSVILSSLVMHRLRTRHADTWESMGRPTRLNLSDRVGGPEGEHFWLTGYKKLNDPKFEELVEVLKTFNKIFSIITLVLLVLMVVKLIMGYI